MELMNFLRSLKRYKAILIFVPLLTGILAFFVAMQLPDKYISHARLASSLADKSQQLNDENNQQDFKVNQEFDNLLQTLTLNKVVDRVSYKLILHDLQTKTPFRRPGKQISELTPSERNDAVKTFTAFYNDRRSLNLANSNEKELFKMLKSMKYDYASLKKNLWATRMDNSQYLNLEYSSENPQLSAYVLNTLSDEFITYYTTVSNANENKTLHYLDSLMHEKQSVLNTQMEALKKYKIDNGILNIDDQAKTIYGQIADIETRKGTAEKDMVAYDVALKNIDNRFAPGNRKYLESSVSAINSGIINTKDELKTANDAYIQSGFNEKYKTRIDSLQKKLTHQIYDQSDNYSFNPAAAKDNLVAQKLNLEISRDLAKNSVRSLDNELGKMNSSMQKLVPNLATIQAYQAQIEVADKEYAEILKKYNQASLAANYNAPVRLVEKAIPGEAVPNKKILLVAFSSIASLAICLLIFFIIFYFDKSIQSPDQLEEMFDMTVLGSLNHMWTKNSSFNLQDIWSRDAGDAGSLAFKNSLRSIRYEIESNLKNDENIIAVTSLYEGEGKTFFTESLAYAFSKMNKKVVIIDGNFMHPEISNTFKGPNYLEKFLLENTEAKMVDTGLINIIGNKGGDGSLLELNSSDNIRSFFAVLKSIYDVIIIETSAFESVNKVNVKEWISFAEKVVVVFESGRQIDGLAAKHIRYLKELGGKLSGVVLNNSVVPPATANGTLLIGRPRNEQAAYS
jgi:polysaccharide biosynthesis transport protein